MINLDLNLFKMIDEYEETKNLEKLSTDLINYIN